MGKSTTASIFGEFGSDVWDADAAVHRLYAKDGAATGPISETFFQVMVEGEVSRARLRKLISSDPSALKFIEKIVHPDEDQHYHLEKLVYTYHIFLQHQLIFLSLGI